ncbi:hypothetical protein F5Y05DRAFT_420778 [Hypoxylon sp. FL0543]|nr:hypothetical protein F5Y05DRAFT_420778 [Hypoxylon sp. FL0543]
MRAVHRVSTLKTACREILYSHTPTHARRLWLSSRYTHQFANFLARLFTTAFLSLPRDSNGCWSNLPHHNPSTSIGMSKPSSSMENFGTHHTPTAIMAQAVSKLAPSSSLPSITELTWSIDIPQSRSTLQDRAMDEDKLLKQARHQHANTTSSNENGVNHSIPHPPLFGSTSHRLGMNTEMTILNHKIHNQYAQQAEQHSLNRAHQPFEAKLPNPAKHSQHQRPSPSSPPPLPPISEIPENLQEDDQACRRHSQAAKYWRTTQDRNQWQQALVERLVRAEHAQLDETQPPLLRYARQALRARDLELWYRRRRLARLHDKHARRAAELRRRLEGLTKRGGGDCGVEAWKTLACLSLDAGEED